MNTGIAVLIVYYAAINAALFAAMGIDKALAVKEKRRIPESTLFILGLLGGGIGGLLGMRAFRHKTRKPAFYIIFVFSAALHWAFIYFVYNVFIK